MSLPANFSDADGTGIQVRLPALPTSELQHRLPPSIFLILSIALHFVLPSSFLKDQALVCSLISSSKYCSIRHCFPLTACFVPPHCTTKSTFRAALQYCGHPQFLLGHALLHRHIN